MTTELRGRRRRVGKFLVLLLFGLVGAAFLGSGLYAALTGDASC